MTTVTAECTDEEVSKLAIDHEASWSYTAAQAGAQNSFYLQTLQSKKTGLPKGKTLLPCKATGGIFEPATLGLQSIALIIGHKSTFLDCSIELHRVALCNADNPIHVDPTHSLSNSPLSLSSNLSLASSDEARMQWPSREKLTLVTGSASEDRSTHRS